MKLQRLIGIVLSVLVLVVGMAFFALFASSPKLDGTVIAPELIQEASLSRDQYGMAVVRAQQREDAAFVLGYAHAQDRFFQMDLLRRTAAGELSELFGAKALDFDKSNRLHQFRARAKDILKRLPAQDRLQLTRYTQGVAKGLADLSARPFEYFLLGQQPRPWQAEDSLLAIFAMYLDLQGDNLNRDAVFTLLQQQLTPSQAAFLLPEGTSWDAALDDSYFAGINIPEHAPYQTPSQAAAKSQATAKSDATNAKANSQLGQSTPMDYQEGVGSNSWAVAGALTQGGAMLANDMHLTLRVPTIWYKAQLNYGEQTITGVTLPGAPAIVSGSNGHLAWGFTNSYIDTLDLVELNADAELTEQQETILVSGQDPVQLTVQRSAFGPVTELAGKRYAVNWIAHHPEAVNLQLLNLETVHSVAEALPLAAMIGIPAQNFTLVDSEGNIGWTIIGAIPQRHYDATSVAIAQAVAHPFTELMDYQTRPHRYNPSTERIWTANQRIVSLAEHQQLGSGGYANGARAKQIKERLFEQEQFVEADMLRIQTDADARFLQRWQQLLVNNVLTDDAVARLSLQSFKAAVSAWQRCACVDSVGYTAVRQFRLTVQQALLAKLDAAVADTDYNLGPLKAQFEQPMWQLVTEQPQSWLPDGQSWATLLQDLAKLTEQQLIEQYGSLEQATWGRANTVALAHPFASISPVLKPLLNMPEYPSNGDSNMPFVQGKQFGSSERFVVRPGHEQSAILSLPGGQSGHPLSPFYRSYFDDFKNVKATALLPQSEKYQIKFKNLDR